VESVRYDFGIISLYPVDGMTAGHMKQKETKYTP
jgi:hypothetical protein